jgi:hypothetical protein
MGVEKIGVRYYDEALLNKLKKWTAGTNVHLTGINETRRMFEVMADNNNDKPIQLPLITISRSGGYTVQSKYKQPRSYMGHTVARNITEGAKLNAIPIGITYQLDIYTRYLEEADEYARNIVFNIINYPKLEIEIPYENMGITHVANIRLTTEVEDNSDIQERLIPGQFTRFTIGFDIDDAYLFDVRIRDNLSIVSYDADVKDKDDLIAK